LDTLQLAEGDSLSYLKKKDSRQAGMTRNSIQNPEEPLFISITPLSILI